MAASHLLVPRLLARLVRTELDGTAEVYARMFAIRNAALAIGLANIDRMTNPRQFLQINAVIDAVDAGAFLVASGRRDVDTQVVVIGAGIALGATALGLAALRATS